ncbi:MAG: hypothetical protein ACI9SE_004151 [Neolewinella sp.]|jgi:hypothetical protein
MRPCSNVVLASVLRAFIRVRRAHCAAYAHTQHLQTQRNRTPQEPHSLKGTAQATPNTNACWHLVNERFGSLTQSSDGAVNVGVGGVRQDPSGRRDGQRLAREERAVPVPGRFITYTRARRNRSAFAITETELRLIAAAAIIGLKSQPVIG